MKKSVLLVAAVIMITVSPIFAQKTTKKTFTNVKRIDMTTGSGGAEIRKGSGNSVEVEVTYTYDEAVYTPRLEQSGDRLELSEEFRGRNQNGHSNWVITIPDGLRLKLQTGSGDIDVRDLNIDLKAGAGSGTLEFRNVKGTLDAVTGSGEVTLSNYSGEAKVVTGSGNMDIDNSTGELQMTCGSGNIRVSQSNATFAVTTGSGSIVGDKIKIAGGSKFSTGSGRARISLAASPTFDLSVGSGSGDAELNFNGNEITGVVVMKASKRNGSISAPFDFDKTEEIEQGGRDNTTIVKTAQRGNSKNRISVSTGSGDAIIKK